MGVGEIILIVIVGLIILFILYIILNNLKQIKKNKKADKDAKKDVQPIADVSPIPVEEQKSVGKEKSLRVNDPIFDKRGYENITERVELKELIENEHEKENQKIVEKLHNIEIVTKPVDTTNLEGINLTENNQAEDEKLFEEVKVEKEPENIENAKQEESRNKTVEIIKKMVEDEKNNKK